MKTLPASLALLAAIASSVFADVTLPAIFSDHMVLLRDARVPVWGLSAPGEKVTVGFAGQSVSTTAGADGKWQVALTGLKTGAPQTLTIEAGNRIEIHDVIVGEVWLGSGQSNMAMMVSGAKNFEHERSTAAYPLIRHFKEESGGASTAQQAGQGKWVVCTPETVGGFSAALYFFGREIHRTLDVPVGLVHSSVGGTPIEAWIASEALRASAVLEPFIAAVDQEVAGLMSPAAQQKYQEDLTAWEVDAKKARAENLKVPRKPQDPAGVASRKACGSLFNGKVAPLVPFAVRGVLWYQGEANTGPAKAPFYQHLLPLLVNDWRSRWGCEFPFAWVQLPNFADTRDWPTVREAMRKTLSLPQTGMAITIDIGEAGNIHPKNKQDVGHRLALWALGDVYGRKVPATSGPLLADRSLRGAEIVLEFAHADGGLVAKDGELMGFVIAGTDRRWRPARARIAGDTVIVSSPEIEAPVAVRYAWENVPVCNLFNGAGLPASPFRTDDW